MTPFVIFARLRAKGFSAEDALRDGVTLDVENPKPILNELLLATEDGESAFQAVERKYDISWKANR